MMYYDLVDDEGNIINQKRLSFFHSIPKSQYHVNELYDALERLPKFITIKPYTFTVKPADWSIVGESKGADGKVVYENKTYIQDLEMTIPVQP
ncbi:DUF5643 domain-containing protein [Paenibacillus sp. ACRSA]|nr:DUF5643 domain-containing protein [Paenibacillus sp. ACRSA]